MASVLTTCFAVFLALVAGVGSPLLGSVVFCVAALLLRCLGRPELVGKVLLPVFFAVKAVPHVLMR